MSQPKNQRPLPPAPVPVQQGIFTEYLNRQMSFPDLTAERQKQLRRISEFRGRDILVIAADFNKSRDPIGIDYSDLLPINDQLSILSGDAIDVILETPGGSGEVAEDIVRLLHEKYSEVGIIIPGWSKSAGTVIAMAGDEILMEPASAVGPIDAQLNWQGKVFSADALLEGMEKIKKEVEDTGVLNRAYIPMLQAMSPGEIQSAENTLKFTRALVTDWLFRYKFKNWNIHSTSGTPVTDEEKRVRAEEIAGKLCNHRLWLTHGRSIKMTDLEDMGLRITDYTQEAELADAIRRYYTLLHMTFGTIIYKVFETIPNSAIFRFSIPQGSPQIMPTDPDHANADVTCGGCKQTFRIQMNLKAGIPLEPGTIGVPATNRVNCPNCGMEIDLSELRRQIEVQTKKQVVS